MPLHNSLAHKLGSQNAFSSIDSSLAAFMWATKSAIQQLGAGDWEIALRSAKQSALEGQLA
jgi:hypothetical protein